MSGAARSTCSLLALLFLLQSGEVRGELSPFDLSVLDARYGFSNDAFDGGRLAAGSVALNRLSASVLTAETDPFWNAQKSLYALVSELAQYATVAYVQSLGYVTLPQVQAEVSGAGYVTMADVRAEGFYVSVYATNTLPITTCYTNTCLTNVILGSPLVKQYATNRLYLQSGLVVSQTVNEVVTP